MVNAGRWLSSAATVVIVCCALVVTGLVVRRELFAPTGAEAIEAEVVEEWHEYARGGQSVGPADAPITIVLFSDFQCPACRSLATHLKAVRAEDPDRIRVVYRHYPLPRHPHAMSAARASECAAEQGRFEQYHDALFERQAEIGEMPWSGFAELAGIPDTAAFEDCMSDEGPLPQIAADTLAGQRLVVPGTPTLLINGLKITGAPPPDVLRELLAKAQRRRT